MIFKKYMPHKGFAALFCAVHSLVFSLITGECFASLVETIGQVETVGNTAIKAGGAVVGVGAMIAAAAKFGIKAAGAVIVILASAFYTRTWWMAAFTPDVIVDE